MKKPEVFGVPCQIRNMVFNVKPSSDAKDGEVLTNKFQRRSASLIEDSKHTLRVVQDPDKNVAFKFSIRVSYLNKSESEKRRVGLSSVSSENCEKFLQSDLHGESTVLHVVQVSR